MVDAIEPAFGGEPYVVVQSGSPWETATNFRVLNIESPSCLDHEPSLFLCFIHRIGLLVKILLRLFDSNLLGFHPRKLSKVPNPKALMRPH